MYCPKGPTQGEVAKLHKCILNLSKTLQVEGIWHRERNVCNGEEIHWHTVLENLKTLLKIPTANLYTIS